MDPQKLRELLDNVASGATGVEAACERLRTLPFEDLHFARIDHHRALRTGFPEVILGQGKTAAQIEEIFARLVESGSNVLATRIVEPVAEQIKRRFSEACYDGVSRTLSLRQRRPTQVAGFVAIVCAGTGDLPVAEEARVTAEFMDVRTRSIYDVGVAGIHRLLAESKPLREAGAIVVVAGMEGALPSVVAGLVAAPVIAVPTSVGYGASFGGISALLAMLNSCAAGISVVNIDNGFSAGYQAALILHTANREHADGTAD